MASIHFLLRPSTKSGRHPGNLSLRIIHERKIKMLSMGLRMYSEEWDADKQSIIYPENPQRACYLKEVEERMATCVSEIEHLIRILEKQGRYSAQDIISHYCGNKNNNNLLGWVETLSKECIRNRQERLARAYLTVARGLVDYNKGHDIPLNHINNYLIKGFEKHLMNKGRMPNTISYYMRNLRSIYNKAIAAKYVSSHRENPFSGVYTKVKLTTKRALTVEETMRLHKIDFRELKSRYLRYPSASKHIDNLYYSWRLFMFCFFAQGMCFIDLAHLRKETIRDGICSYYRRKTGQQIQVIVNEGMQHIIDSFAMAVKDSPYLFPVLKEGTVNNHHHRQYETALRTQNRRLKFLAKLARIDKPVTTHVARHSFATIARGGGIPTAVISQMLGHTTEKMTHNYLASFDRSYFDQVYNVIVDALSGRPGGPFA